MIDKIFYICRFYYSFRDSESGSWISRSPLRTELDTRRGKYHDRIVLTVFFLSQTYCFPFPPVTLLRIPLFPGHPDLKVNLFNPHHTSLPLPPIFKSMFMDYSSTVFLTFIPFSLLSVPPL